MCISPIKIRNPNAGLKFTYGSPNSLKDCTSAFIEVPCGHCPECISNKQMSIIQRLQMETFDYHLFFCTLTYSPAMIPEIITSSGFVLQYVDYKDFQTMIKRIRKNNLFTRPFKYFAVSERGTLKGRPHMHILFFVRKMPKDTYLDILNLESILRKVVLSQWIRYDSSKNHYSKSTPLLDYKVKIHNSKRFTNYDLHYINNSFDKSDETSVGFYVIKYMMKPNYKEVQLQRALRLNLPEDEYTKTWNLVRSRYYYSKDFGNSKSPKVIEYLKKCVQDSKTQDSLFPKFFNPNSGKSFPLSRFYKSKKQIYSFQDALTFYYNQQTNFIDSPVIRKDDPKIIHQKSLKKINEYEKNLNLIDNDSIIDSLF